MAPSAPPPLPEVPGHRVVFLPVTDSTNRVAANGVGDGSLGPGDVVVADEQREARGRRGRRWTTVPGRSLAASVIVDASRLGRLSALPVLVAVATRRALTSCGADGVLLKWPNDIMRADRKIGGILIETARSPDGATRHVVGIGLNLSTRPADLPEPLRMHASAAGLPPGPETRNRVLAALVGELDLALAQAGSAEDAARRREYVASSWLTGRLVELIEGGRAARRARVDAVTGEGDLVLDGRTIAGERISLLTVLDEAAGADGAR